MSPNQFSRILHDGSSSYKIEKFLGKGSFGFVVQCTKSSTKEKMAVKMMDENYDLVAESELAILEEIRKLDADKNNLVKFIHHFTFERYTCLAFETLDTDLLKMMRRRLSIPLNLSQIRVITQQMLVALNALKSIGLVHTDIKPDNIMLVNRKSYSFKVKLIDFGLGHTVSSLRLGIEIQPVGYRAPEVYLGLPVNEAADMWGLGCVLAVLYLGKHLYPLGYEYEAMRVITQMNGQPDDRILNDGLFTTDFFTKDSPTASWRLKTRCEFMDSEGYDITPYRGFSSKLTSLDDITKIRWGKKSGTKYEDNQAFLSLLKKMLEVDPSKRITPSEALGHRFITMKHFPSDIKDKYVKSAFSTVEKCMLWQPSQEDITCLDDTHPADEETTVETNNGPPATDGVDETTAAAGHYKEQPETTDATTSSSGSHGLPATDGVDETTAAAGHYKEQPETTDATTSSSGSHGLPASDGVDETTAAAGHYKEQPETTDATTSSSGSHGLPASDGVDETTAAAGHYKEQPETTDATTSSSGSHGLPASDGVDETTAAAGHYKEQPETTDATTSSSGSHGLPASDGVDETTAAARDYKEQPETNVANSPSSDTHHSNGVNIGHDKGPRKVKRWRKWFSNLAKMFTCKNVDVIE